MSHLGLRFVVSLALRNLGTRKSRTALTFSGIVLGVAVVLAISITNESTLASIRHIFDEASGRANLIVTSDSVMGDPFDINALVRVRRAAGVEIAAPSVSKRTVLAQDAEDWDVAVTISGTGSTNDLLVFGVDPEVEAAVRQYDIVAGRFLSDDARGYQALLVQDYAQEKGLIVGDDLVILTDTGPEALRVVGTIKESGPGAQNNGAVAIIPIEVAQALFAMGSDLTQIDIVVSPAVAESPRLLEGLRLDLTEDLGSDYQVLYPAARGNVVSRMLAAYQLGLSFFGVIALFVGAFLIYNTFSMTVVERTREIGMLRTLGASRFQILLLVLIEAVLLGAVGSVVGVAFGIFLSRGLSASVSSISAADISELAVPLDDLIKSVLVGVGVTVISATIPAWRARSIPPLEALRAVARQDRLVLGSFGWAVGAGLLLISYVTLYHLPVRPETQYEVGIFSVFCMMLGATLLLPVIISLAERGLRPLITLLYGSPGRLGAGNIRRSMGRTVLTVAALMIGIAMVMGIQVLTASFETDITNWVNTALGGDLYVRSPAPMREEFGQRLLAEPAVTDISPISYHYVRFDAPDGKAERVLFTAIDPATYLAVASFVFQDSMVDVNQAVQDLAAGDAVFISNTLADRYGLKTGDHISLETKRGIQQFLVAGVVVDFSSSGYVVNGARSDLERYFGEGTVNQFVLALQPGLDADAEAERLEERYGDRRHIVVETATDFKEKVLSLTSEAFALFDVLGLIGILVAALGVINTLVMNVLERQREIGGLRSLGMTRDQVALMVLSESAAMGLMGGIFGVLFGLALSQVLLLGTRIIAGYGVNYVLPGQAVIISMIIALIVSQAAAAYPAGRAARLPIIEAIQHE
jgi:putative ABC transport system permease protein